MAPFLDYNHSFSTAAEPEHPFHLSLTATYVAQHSSLESPLRCVSNSFLPFCSSPISIWDVNYNTSSTKIGMKVTSPNTEFYFALDTTGTIDGARIDGSSLLLTSGIYYSNVGFADTLNVYDRLNQFSQFRQGGPNQFAAALATFRLRKFTDRIFYDPDTSLRLLFDFSGPATSTPASLAAEISGGLTSDQIGIIAGVTVAVVALISALVRPPPFPLTLR